MRIGRRLALLGAMAILLVAGWTWLSGFGQDSTAGGSSPQAVATQVAAAVAATVTAHDAPAPDRTQSIGRGLIAASTAAVPQSGAAGATATKSAAAGSTATVQRTARPKSSPSTTHTPVRALVLPIRLSEQELQGARLLPRYWTNAAAIVFSVGVPANAPPGLVPQIELESLATPYRGIASAEGKPAESGETASIVVDVSRLPEGAYHWQARLVDSAGPGPWTNFYDGPAFRLDRTAPSAVAIRSSTYPDQRQTYGTTTGQVSWTVSVDNGALRGYRTSVDRDPHGMPSGVLSLARSAQLGPLKDGTLYFHVRAEDWAGNVGPVVTYVLHIDTAVPKVTHTFFHRYQFNPRYDTLTMHFTPSTAVTVRLTMLRQQTKGAVLKQGVGSAAAGKAFTLSWNGRDFRGKLVPAGQYTMLITLTDRYGNVGTGYFADLSVNYRRIVVHLASQSMDVYDGPRLLKTTLVTTGNKALPTPSGVWHIGAKYHPYTFISPWPKGNLYYYPPSNVEYALYFKAGGYFLHDAPWRTYFGPGSNAGTGVPGTSYTGSRGCVEVPSEVMAWLSSWATIGTVVVVAQ